MSKIDSLKYRVKRLKSHIEKAEQKLHQAQGRRLFMGLLAFALIVGSQIAKGFYLEFMGLFVAMPAFFVLLKETSRFLPEARRS